MNRSPISYLPIVLGGLVCVNCSHGKGASDISTLSIAIRPSTAMMAPGQALPFAASITGPSGAAVTWTVSEGASGGTVSSQGLYVAPQEIGTYHLVATSAQDSTVSATADIVVVDQGNRASGGSIPVGNGGTAGASGASGSGGAGGRSSGGGTAGTGNGGTIVGTGGSAGASGGRAGGGNGGTTVSTGGKAGASGASGAGVGGTSDNIVVSGGPVTFVHPASPDPPALYPPSGDIPSGTSDFLVTIATSRTSGVAPLYAFFDARATLTASDGDVDMEATYIWSFDTTGVDTYTKYDRASGFVSGHVFNQPGTYTVRLDVFDAKKRHGYATTTITVSDFNGKTYYASLSGNDANAGTLQSPFKSVAHALSLAAPNTRILFRNGDVFNVTAMSATGKGPVIIGGYSDPAQPSSGLPEWHSTAVNSDNGILSMDTDDWRIVGLRISSGGCTSGVTNAAGITSPMYPGAIGFHGTNNLLSRCDFVNLGGEVVDISADGSAVYECEMHKLSSYGFWTTETGIKTANQRNSIIGNYLHDWEGDLLEHAFRMQTGHAFFLGFNVIEANRTMTNTQIRGNSDHVVIYGNVMDRVTGFNPASANDVALIHHCIADSNVFIGRTDSSYTTDSVIRDYAVVIAAKDIVVRNNIFYNYATATSLTDMRPTIDVSTRIHLENNTILCPVVGCKFDTQFSSLSVFSYNNLLYSAASTTNIYDQFYSLNNSPLDGKSDYNQFAGVAWSASTPLFGWAPAVTWADWQSQTGQDTHSHLADPQISVLNPAAAGFARPGASSAGVNAGFVTGNFADATGRIRDANPDIGAFEVFP